MTDYYGSCSGCDAWDGACEEDARRMINDLVTNAKIFDNRKKAIKWIKNLDSSKEPWNYPFESAKHLITDLEK
jgi:predicted ATP-dependent serine protease